MSDYITVSVFEAAKTKPKKLTFVLVALYLFGISVFVSVLNGWSIHENDPQRITTIVTAKDQSTSCSKYGCSLDSTIHTEHKGKRIRLNVPDSTFSDYEVGGYVTHDYSEKRVTFTGFVEFTLLAMSMFLSLIVSLMALIALIIDFFILLAREETSL